MNKQGWMVVAVLLLIVVGMTTWAVFFRRSPQLAKIDTLRTQVEDQALPQEERQAAMRQMNEEMGKLSPEERELVEIQMEDERDRQAAERQEKELAQFFAMPKEQQIAEIDRRLDQEQREQRQQNRGGRDGGNQGGRNNNGPGGGGQGGGGGGRGGRGGGGGGGGGRGGAAQAGGGKQSFGVGENGKSAAAERNKKQINSGSPTMRAQQDEMRRMMSDRRNTRR